MHSAKSTILQFFFEKSFLNLLKPRGVNRAKADRTVMAQSEKSIICKKSRLTALHAGIVLTPDREERIDATLLWRQISANFRRISTLNISNSACHFNSTLLQCEHVSLIDVNLNIEYVKFK
jgi:hypothetical protein